jgi:hypothetical protein
MYTFIFNVRIVTKAPFCVIVSELMRIELCACNNDLLCTARERAKIRLTYMKSFLVIGTNRLPCCNYII